MAKLVPTDALRAHRRELLACKQCPEMIGPVVSGRPVHSKVLLLGQAPGPHEGKHGKPFAWTAGKTLFKWFASIGMTEDCFRSRVYMAAVCRCFPGKNPKGGDRIPSRNEIVTCQQWLRREVEILRPSLLLPVGKLAISQVQAIKNLKDIVGKQTKVELFGRSMDMIALPHPSGASTWHRTEPGRTLLTQALARVQSHPCFAEIVP